MKNHFCMLWAAFLLLTINLKADQSLVPPSQPQGHANALLNGEAVGQQAPSVCLFSKTSRPPKIWTEEYSNCVRSLVASNKTLLSLAQAQVGDVCPHYSQLRQDERANFIHSYIKNWANLESNGDTNAAVTLQAEEQTEGLFMLRKSDLEFCGFSHDRNRKDPLISIQCAINLMAGHKAAFGFTRDIKNYVFSPLFLRHPAPKKARFMESLKSEVPSCFNS